MGQIDFVADARWLRSQQRTGPPHGYVGNRALKASEEKLTIRPKRSPRVSLRAWWAMFQAPSRDGGCITAHRAGPCITRMTRCPCRTREVTCQRLLIAAMASTTCDALYRRSFRCPVPSHSATMDRDQALEVSPFLGITDLGFLPHITLRPPTREGCRYPAFRIHLRPVHVQHRFPGDPRRLARHRRFALTVV